jgi:hypothetical protein
MIIPGVDRRHAFSPGKVRGWNGLREIDLAPEDLQTPPAQHIQRSEFTDMAVGGASCNAPLLPRRAGRISP